MNIYDVKILKLFQSSFEVIFRAKRGQTTFSVKKKTISIMWDQALPSGKDVFLPLVLMAFPMISSDAHQKKVACPLFHLFNHLFQDRITLF
jgi:hypothetical protein